MWRRKARTPRDLARLTHRERDGDGRWRARVGKVEENTRVLTYEAHLLP